MTEVPEDQVRGLEREAGEMEEGLEHLQDDIDTAHQKAEEQRERARPEGVAGDWEDESAGAQQGDDAEDAAGREGPGGEPPGGDGESGEAGDGESGEADDGESGQAGDGESGQAAAGESGEAGGGESRG